MFHWVGQLTGTYHSRVSLPAGTASTGWRRETFPCERAIPRIQRGVLHAQLYEDMARLGLGMVGMSRILRSCSHRPLKHHVHREPSLPQACPSVSLFSTCVCARTAVPLSSWLSWTLVGGGRGECRCNFPEHIGAAHNSLTSWLEQHGNQHFWSTRLTIVLLQDPALPKMQNLAHVYAVQKHYAHAQKQHGKPDNPRATERLRSRMYQFDDI